MTRVGRVRAGLAIAFAAASLLLVGACTGSGSPAASPAGSIPPVVRAILAAGDPAGADGQHLELVRYTIQPGTALPAHHHPGMQLAFIESGTLTYTVIAGSVTITGVDGVTRTVGPGETARVVTGEWLVESEEIVHFGENGGSEPVVILAASLLEAGQPPAIPVATPPQGSAPPGGSPGRPSSAAPGVGSPAPSG